MGGQSLSPGSNLPFPHLISDQPFPSEFDASDAADLFPAHPPAARMDQKSGFQQHKASLRWLDSPTAQNGSGSSTPVRVPSLTSATTAPSVFHRPDDACFPRGGNANEHEATPATEATVSSRAHHLHMANQKVPSHNGTQGSVRQRVARAFSSKKRISIIPWAYTSSPPSPINCENPTPIFASNPSLANLNSHCECGVMSTIEDRRLCSEAVCGAFHTTNESIELGKRHVRDIPKTTRRLRRKSSARSEIEHPVPFDAAAGLTLQDLRNVENLEVFDQDNQTVRFGDLWQGQRTCVIFIRHFWCPLCTDYMQKITEQADPRMLTKAGVNLIVISNGSPAMIKSYRNIFKFPFPLYTDPSRALYRALGMTLRTTDGGPDVERGDYVEHGMASGIALVLKNALRTRMPVHKPGGDIKQLGGEFVLGPGLCCSYVSRMHNTRSHAPILDVLSAAGVDLDWDPVMDASPPQLNEEEQWMNEREVELRRIRARKGRRRGFSQEPRSSESGE